MKILVADNTNLQGGPVAGDSRARVRPCAGRAHRPVPPAAAGWPGWYLREFDADARGDDGTAINAYCYLTPLPIGFGPGTLGVLNSVQVVLGESADTVDWELRFGRTAEEAKNANAMHTGKWFAGGLQREMRQRGRGAVALLKVANDTLGETFAIETIIGVAREAGKIRL